VWGQQKRLIMGTAEAVVQTILAAIESADSGM
jgi:hypothetical protein